MMYPPPPRIRARRFFREVKPRSATQMTRERVHSLMSSRTWADQVVIGGAARPGPDPDRDAVAGDRHADHHLGQVIA